MKISILQKLVEKVLGKKYYVCVVGMVGSGQYFVNSTLYRSKEEVERYHQSLATNQSIIFIGSYSFRSTNDFHITINR